MKKSVRINMLVITSVLAIFVFAGVWYLRPGVSNEMLDLAKQRQLQPLLEIGEPLRLSKEATSDITVDQKELAQQLLPSLKKELSLSLEDDLYEKLKDRFANDDQVLALFVDRLEPVLVEKLSPAMQTAFANYRESVMNEEIASSLAVFKDTIQKEFDARFAQLTSDLKQASATQLEGQVSILKGEISNEVSAYIPQLVDLLLPQVVEGVYKDLTDNKETYMPYFAEELKPYFPQVLDEQQLVALYGTYRDRIVADLVPSILDSLEKPAKSMVDSMVETVKPTTIVPAAPAKPSVAKTPVVSPEVVANPVTVAPAIAPVGSPEVVAKPATVAPVIAPVVSPEVVAEAATVVPAATIIEPAKAKVSLPVVTVPVFSEKEPVVFIEPTEYDQKRDEIRKLAIDQILERLNAVE
ncbi:hypothetical protein SpiGrapes_1191 [Sphaerochaeta pleomorpha str. Grapes]|uniref:Uncharacterized protein n=1 Tax=Sphaerochaeta pleomorpha (strain ATCC BAA-1885 / DSM 22778 / Grapes) TaxID=158190 RepID=G8QSP7_SPHPG|nr:hypothetical protein [Sphaerochaeta pleomorpha]AEV29008.1 hypothetical protein SpiGrapes_1191 [Sphaerochaeta pleomorpha str. Grapes]